MTEYRRFPERSDLSPWLLFGVVGVCVAGLIAVLGATLLPWTVEAAYYGRSLPALNALITGQSENPLSSYLSAVDGYVQGAELVLLLAAVLVSVVALLPLRVRPWVPSVLLSTAFAINAVALVAKYHIDLPVEDHLMMVELLERAHMGTLTFTDLWRPYNDVHRMLAPKLWMLSIAEISRFSVALEIALNLVLLFALFAVVAIDVLRGSGAPAAPGGRWLLVGLSAMIFSLAQWENFFLPMQWFVLTTATVGGLVLLSRASWPAFLSGIGIGLIAAFSSANGLLFWLVGIIVVFLRSDESSARKVPDWRRIAVFLGVSLTVFVLYFHELRPVATGETTPLMNASKPLQIIRFVLSYLGAPVTTVGWLSQVIGGLGLMMFVWLAVRLMTIRAEARASTAPYLAIALFSVGSGAMTALGRLEEFGLSRALESSYMTVAILFWVGVSVMLFRVITATTTHARTHRFELLTKRLSLFLLTTVMTLSIWTSTTSRRDAAIWMQLHKRAPAAQELLSTPPSAWSDATLSRLSGGPPASIRAGFMSLYNLKLAAFAK